MKISIIVHPNSKKPRVEKDLMNNTHIYVKEPALEGKANQAVLKVLSELYKLPINQIILVTGIKSKFKVFEINKL